MVSSNLLRRSFVAGIALVAPLVVTVVAVRLLFGWLRGLLNPLIDGTGLTGLTGNIEFLAQLGALLVLVVAITLLGYLAQRSVGARAFGLFDRLVGLIPMVSVIYSSVRQVSDALVNQDSRYERVVLVEYPRQGVYSLGFVTAESPSSVETAAGDELYNVYLPGSPNPTQGHFTLVPTEETVELDMTVSRAIRLLVTTGIADQQDDVDALRAETDPRIDTGGE